MILQFTEQALKDLDYWRAHAPQKLIRVKTLPGNIMETPGLANPKP
jgi:hypothetical protein